MTNISMNLLLVKFRQEFGLRLFTEVLSIVQSQYVDEVPPKDIIYGAIKGTLRGLDMAKAAMS